MESSYCMDNRLKNEKAIIILSFDDGRKDQLRIAQYLQEQGFPAVFNITPGYLDGKCPELTEIPPMTKEDVRWIAEQPEFEIAAHGNMHENLVSDIVQGKENLLNLLKHQNANRDNGQSSVEKALSICVGFASPGSRMTPIFIKRHEQQLRKIGFSYVRTGNVVYSWKCFRSLCRKVGRIVHMPLLYRLAYEESLNDKEENFCFTSVPIMADTTLKEQKAIINVAIRRNQVCVLMFHSILDKGEKGYRELWTWDNKKFNDLMEYLKERQSKEELSVMTVKQYLNLQAK